MTELEMAYALDKPYLGDMLGADQGHHRFKYFPAIVHDVRTMHSKRTLNILEVGSWAGGSIKAWDDACQSDCFLTCIDHWKPHLKKMQHVADEARRLFFHNTRVWGLTPRLQVLEGPSEEILKQLSAESYDIIFIDGDHRWECILNDIRLSKNLVRTWGILCGDDLEKQVDQVLNIKLFDYAIAKGIDGVRDDDNVGYHPGVTKAVHDEFGRVIGLDGLWAMHKLVGGKFISCGFFGV